MGAGGARRGEGGREAIYEVSKLREVKVAGTANERTGQRYEREREREKESWKEKEGRERRAREREHDKRGGELNE